MSIASVPEIKVGHFVEIKSDKGGCDKAPCTKEVGAITKDGSGFYSVDPDDDGVVFKVNHNDYIGTVYIAGNEDRPAVTLHQYHK